LLTGFTRAWLFWIDIAPSTICMCSFIDYLSLNIIVFSSLIHHLIIFHCPIADLNTACFSFLGSTVLPLVAQLLKECRGLQCHFYQGFRRLNWCSFVSENLPCFGINSYLKDHVYSKSSLLKWNQRCPFFEKSFWKSSFFDQRPNTCYSKYTVLWLSCILKTEIDPL
jgi:hypothetical protein